jgi:hypothetical protein
MKKIVMAVLLPLALYAGTHKVFSQESSAAGKPRGPFMPDTMYLTLGPVGILNTADAVTSAPSPILFTPGFAAGWNVYENFFSISVEGRLSFFMNHYLWDGQNALPAEIEHRTAFVTTILLDIPVLYTQEFGPHAIHAGLGLAFAFRLSFLAWNVKPSDSGASGDAAGDVGLIGAWFYQKGRFIYPELVLGWDCAIGNGWRAGIDARVYFPLGNGANAAANPLDGGMASLAVRICLPL